MKFEINMINVKDGDSIILQLEKEEKKALIVIDGGYEEHYPKLKKRIEELLPSYNNKIDLIICSHFDNDHLEGISYLLDDCNKNEIEIGEIWLHKIEGTLSKLIEGMDEKLKHQIDVVIPEKKRLWELSHFKTGFDLLDNYDNSKDQLVIENYKFLMKLLQKMIDYGLESKIKEVTRGYCLPDFEEFYVVSPTAEYYDSFLPKLKQEKLLNEVVQLTEENTLQEGQQEKSIGEKIFDIMSPCDRLMKKSTGVTPTNMVSIVTMLKTDDLKLLFTADSGIESYQSQDILDGELYNLDWLQLPHHGSKNNTSKIMLDHFNPKIVFVSGEGVENRPSTTIIKCLKTKDRFEKHYVTNEEENTWYLKIGNELKTERVLINQ